jgi:DsbE subfamily thiol:disulfide oxidoreductase
VTHLRRAVQAAALSFFFVAAARSADIGKPAPAFKLADLSGKEVSLTSLKGQVVFLNFWASWCAPCKVEFPRLNELSATYEKKGVRVIAINLDHDLANARKFLEKDLKAPVRLTVLLDPKSAVAESYDVEAMPSSFVIDGEGIVRYTHLGYQKGDEAKWSKEIDALLAGKK